MFTNISQAIYLLQININQIYPQFFVIPIDIAYEFEDAVNSYKKFVDELQNSSNVLERLKNDAKNTFAFMIVYNMAVKKDKKAARKAYDKALSIYPDINEDIDFKKF